MSFILKIFKRARFSKESLLTHSHTLICSRLQAAAKTLQPISNSFVSLISSIITTLINFERLNLYPVSSFRIHVYIVPYYIDIYSEICPKRLILWRTLLVLRYRLLVLVKYITFLAEHKIIFHICSAPHIW